LEKNGHKLRDIIAVSLNLRSMADFGEVNSEYSVTIGADHPPVRVCVELPLADDVTIAMSVFGKVLTDSFDSFLRSIEVSEHGF
jgi:enamine deaminase RidA (YjgF/YER057c/UK114 family)